MVNYAVISGKVLDAAGNPVPNASIVFNPVIAQVVQGQFVQPVIVNTLTGDDGTMIPVSLPWGLVVQITVNNAAPFSVIIPAIGAVSFGALAMNAWPVLTFSPPSFFILEEFPPISTTSGQIGANGWTAYTIGGAPTISLITAEQDHPGIVRLTTTATTGQGGALALTASAAVQLTNGIINDVNWQMNLVFRLNQVTACRFLSGLVNNFSVGPATTYLGIRFDTVAPDTNFQFVASNGGGPNVTLVDTGIVADTNWHTLQMSVAAPGNVLFSLDYKAPVSISTNLPTAGLTPAFQLLTTANVAKTLDIDFFSFAAPSFAR